MGTPVLVVKDGEPLGEICRQPGNSGRTRAEPWAVNGAREVQVGADGLLRSSTSRFLVASDHHWGSSPFLRRRRCSRRTALSPSDSGTKGDRLSRFAANAPAVPG